MGDEVTVLTGMPRYGHKDIPSEYRGRLLHHTYFRGAKVLQTFVYVPPIASHQWLSSEYQLLELYSHVCYHWSPVGRILENEV